MSIRFLLDEHLAPVIAVQLRLRGIDAVTVVESGRRTLPDDSHFAWALNEGRVIVTHDHDFLALARRAERHAGVVHVSSSRSIGSIVRRLESIAAEFAAGGFESRIEHL